MDIIANDLPRFGQDITEYKTALDDLDKNQIQLLAHMNELQNMWEGEAHEALMQSFNTDYTKVVEIVNFLKEIHGDLTFADTEYGNCENEVANIIANMDI